MIRLPLARPVIGDEEIEAVVGVLQSGNLVQGTQVAAFEEALSRELGMTTTVCCSSGTAALHLALTALKCGPGDEVIVPAFGFPATANAVELCGARAVPADVDPETFALDVGFMERIAGPRVVGVIPVHAFGIPAPMPAIERLADGRGWWIVEDAACSLGTTQGSRWGTGRHLTCLSFHPRKVLTTGEGGAVATDDEALAGRLRCLRSHGMVTDASSGWLRFQEAGFNYRMTDIAGCLGAVQVQRLGRIVAARRQVVGWYRQRLDSHPLVRWPRGYEEPELSMQSLVVVLGGGVDRDQVLQTMESAGIGTTIGGYSVPEQPYYRRRYGLDPKAYPVSTALAQQSLTLPLTTTMVEGEVDEVVSVLDGAVAAGGGR